MSCYFNFDFDFIVTGYIYASITYIAFLFANHVYQFPPSFASASTGNDFYQEVNQLLNYGDYLSMKQQITKYTTTLKIIYPHVGYQALTRASEFLSQGLSGNDTLQHLGLPTTYELDLTPDDLDEDFCRDLVVHHFQHYPSLLAR